MWLAAVCFPIFRTGRNGVAALKRLKAAQQGDYTCPYFGSNREYVMWAIQKAQDWGKYCTLYSCGKRVHGSHSEPPNQFASGGSQLESSTARCSYYHSREANQALSEVSAIVDGLENFQCDQQSHWPAKATGFALMSFRLCCSKARNWWQIFLFSKLQ